MCFFSQVSWVDKSKHVIWTDQPAMALVDISGYITMLHTSPVLLMNCNKSAAPICSKFVSLEDIWKHLPIQMDHGHPFFQFLGLTNPCVFHGIQKTMDRSTSAFGSFQDPWRPKSHDKTRVFLPVALRLKPVTKSLVAMGFVALPSGECCFQVRFISFGFLWSIKWWMNTYSKWWMSQQIVASLTVTTVTTGINWVTTSQRPPNAKYLGRLPWRPAWACPPDSIHLCRPACCATCAVVKTTTSGRGVSSVSGSSGSVWSFNLLMINKFNIHMSRFNWCNPFFQWFPRWMKARKKKNKMKPTNPNADTYVDKQRQYFFVTLPTNSLVRHPEFTHWGGTLVGHPCLTLLRNALVRHSCLTLTWDTLAWHCLLDTLVRHSYLTFL